MNKKLLLFTFISLIFLILSINAVSGFFHYPEYRTDDFRETTEFKQTTERKISDPWYFESTKRTITETTEFRKRTRTPIYSYYSYSPKRYDYNYAPSFSNWRYKEPYKARNFGNSRNDEYYYKPRYDPGLGYYNWRW